MGLVGALIMGGIVFLINYSFGWQPAAIAALKQATYTFFFGGLVIKFCENLSTWYPSKMISILVATLLPALLAITATLILHQIKGTPKPIESTIPTVLLSVPGFLFIGFRHRSQSDRISDNE